MPTKEEMAKSEVAYQLSEASARLSGMEPTTSPQYMALRARVIAGEIDSNQAVELLLAEYTKKYAKSV